MTVTDQLKMFNDKIKANQTQYDLSREAAKTSALSSKNLDKYKYLTGEDLGHKQSVVEKAKFKYCPLGMVLTNNTKNKKTKNNKMKNKSKQDKNLLQNSQHSFVKFKDVDYFKELSFDSIYKRLTDFQKRFNKLKIVNPQADEKNLKAKVLDDVGDLFDELYYIYKDKYNEKKWFKYKKQKQI